MVAKAMFTYPVRFAATSYAVEVQTDNNPANDETLTFPASGSLSTTTDYFVSGDGSATDLLTLFEACLEQHTSIGTDCTVTLSTSTFKVTVDPGASASSVNLLWSDVNTTLDPTVFGWIASTDSGDGATVTSPNVPQGIARPDAAPADDSREIQPVVGGTTIALSGEVRTSRIALPKKRRDLRFHLLNRNVTLTEYLASDRPYASLEYLWTNALSLGRVVHYYPDETDITTTSYSAYRTRDVAQYPLTRNGTFPIRWDARFELIED